MFEKLGAKKFAVPALAVVLISCVMALIFYPILNMKPNELPFAVLSLDEGAGTGRSRRSSERQCCSR